MRSTRCKGRGAAFWRAPNCSPDVRTSPCKPHPALPAAAAAGPPVPFPSSNLKSSTDLPSPAPTYSQIRPTSSQTQVWAFIPLCCSTPSGGENRVRELEICSRSHTAGDKAGRNTGLRPPRHLTPQCAGRPCPRPPCSGLPSSASQNPTPQHFLKVFSNGGVTATSCFLPPEPTGPFRDLNKWPRKDTRGPGHKPASQEVPPGFRARGTLYPGVLVWLPQTEGCPRCWAPFCILSGPPTLGTSNAQCLVGWPRQEASSTLAEGL